MKKTILVALALLGFLLTVHDAHAQSGWGYDPGEARMRYTHEACAQMPLLACQQYVLQHVIGVQPPYGYGGYYGGGYGYGGYGRGMSVKSAIVLGGYRAIRSHDDKNKLADACMLGDEQACRLLRLKDEKRYRKVMEARSEFEPER